MHATLELAIGLLVPIGALLVLWFGLPVLLERVLLTPAQREALRRLDEGGRREVG